jgi:glycosyltransferase involved in cell wall biosynthesis
MADQTVIKSGPRILFVGPMLGRHPGWVPNPSEILAPKFVNEGYVCLLTSHVLNRYARLVDIVYTLLRERGKYDIVSLQVYAGPSFIVEDIASRIAALLGKRIVMVLHGGDLPSFMKQFPRWSLRVLRRADIIVTPSAYLQEALSQYGFESRVIPNMLDMKKYIFRLRDRVQPQLLWMRTFYEYCHPEFAVQVLEQLSKLHPNAILTMAGQDNGLLEPTRKLVEKKRLQDQVHFAGFLDEEGKRLEFAAHDIYLNTNRVDNMPIAVIEAAAFGLPVVAMSVGGIPYLLEDGQTGLLTNFGDVGAMVDAVCRLIEQPHLTAHISAQGRKLAERSAWENVFPLWDKIYRQALGET